MKSLSRILTAVLCCAPLSGAFAGPVATTNGSNLTSYNPSNANNNQWATLSNGRYDTNTTAKVDFGNCNAVVLRCAQPKCANGGCAETSVASAIVSGCVQSNSTCKQYGDDLVQYMTAQLVASSNAKINEQNAAAAQAAATAAAAASAQQAAQSQAQMQQMQEQMQQMQQQMAYQQEQSQQQLQAALAAQQAQSAAALEQMKTAATDAAVSNEAGVSAYQQEAINRGISTDVLERQKISGQIMTEIENAEVSLKTMQTVMNTAFEYAGCDARGNNCKGPKRIKKWRELATEFLEPYDNTIDKIYDALTIAQTVGVDLSDIYMMLNNSCNSWGQYMCPKTPGGTITYIGTTDGGKSVPQVCVDNGTCQQCNLLKVLTNNEDVYEGWVNSEDDITKNNVTIVACASGALDGAKIFARRTKNKNGAGLVDIDAIDLWLNQVEPDKKYDNAPDPYKYCFYNNNDKQTLRSATLSKSVNTKDLYYDINGQSFIKATNSDGAGYVNPTYAICDVHMFNAGVKDLSEKLVKLSESECEIQWKNLSDNEGLLDKTTWLENCQKGQSVDTEEIKEMVGLKTTVISQQMYKQYEYIKATLRRLQVQLEKATLTAKLEAAGATSDGSSSSGLLGSNSSKTSQYRDCSGKNKQGTLDCLRENYSMLKVQVNGKQCDKYAKKQIQSDIALANDLLSTKVNCPDGTSDCKTGPSSVKDCEEYLKKYSSAMTNLDDEILDATAKRSGYGQR